MPELVRDFLFELQRAEELSTERDNAVSEPHKSIENLLISFFNYLVLE